MFGAFWHAILLQVASADLICQRLCTTERARQAHSMFANGHASSAVDDWIKIIASRMYVCDCLFCFCFRQYDVIRGGMNKRAEATI